MIVEDSSDSNLMIYCSNCKFSSHPGDKLAYQVFVGCDEGRRCREVQDRISGDGKLTTYDILDRSGKAAEAVLARK